MTTIIATLLLGCLAGAWTLSPLWRVSADCDPGDGLEVEDRVTAWREEKDRLVAEMVSLDLAFAEGRIDQANYEIERNKVMSEAESAADELRKARFGSTPKTSVARTYPLVGGLLAGSVVLGTVALTVLLNGNDVRTNSNPHADGRVPLTAEQAASSVPKTSAGMANGAATATAAAAGPPIGPDGAPDVSAMVAKLEAKVKAGGATLDETMMLARSYRVVGREEESIAIYRQAQSMAPNERPLSLVLASALLRSGKDADRDEAERIVDKALVDEPLKPEALWLKSLGLIRRHEIAPAKEMLAKLKGIVGENTDAKAAVTGLLAELDGAGAATGNAPPAAGAVVPADSHTASDKPATSPSTTPSAAPVTPAPQ